MATALQPNARPAPIIVMFAKECPSARSRYGSRLARPRPTSTSVIMSSSELCAVSRGGEHSAAPIMPTTIALTATYS